MAKDLIFYRDKSEKFKCSLHVDGASVANTSVRLCLEMKNGANYFFKGKIGTDGQCIIPIPALPQINEEGGTAVVEVIADANYFKVYESAFKIKNSISVKFVPEIEEDEEIDEDERPKISFELISEQEEEPIVEAKKEEQFPGKKVVKKTEPYSIGDTVEIESKNGKVKMKIISIDSNMVKGDWLNAPKDSGTKMFTIKKTDLNNTPYKIVEGIEEEDDLIKKLTNW